MNLLERGAKIKTFEYMEKYFSDLRTRKKDLERNRVQLQAERQKLDCEFEAAFLADSGEKEIQDRMARVDFDISAIDKKIHILDHAEHGSAILTELAKAVVMEGRDIADGLKADATKQADKCISLRDDYIQALADLGKIHRAGAEISYKCGTASQYIPGAKQFIGIPDLWSTVKPDAGLCERKYNQKQF
ncbi:hypothetical protein [Desulfobacter postgatei]|jgi:hypothetical protein|uniref:hypothetical protein n=1 Tax=Desulfobacter postgatei TaxID=2293 RepID=UPI002A36AA19|nr:hypothetical protein [Desulfobacter postgatei]MDX9965163.1 hypothetical protein [Desulfobacter postgatei]